MTGDQARASLLNDTFAAKFTDPTVTRLPSSPVYQLDNLTRFHVTDAAVLAALKAVSPYKACGPDNISARVVAECAEELAVPLAILCRASVSSGVFPKRWKSANIVPIFKKGDKKIPSNYRSVSLLPLFGKVLERVVYDQLFRHASPVIGAEQHGFMPQRSCATNLAVYLRSAWEAISDGYQTDAIYTDYSAAFQSVNHSLLTHKLKQSFHVHDFALKWFVSYLSDRRQRVIVNGKTSHWQPVTSGVPEGSLLAPLLFSLFINDLSSTISSGCLMYADDVKIFRKITSPSDSQELQRDLDRLTAWSACWGLSLNPSKCKSFTMTLRRAPVQITYNIGGTVLEHVDQIRDLGIIIDSKLTFAQHVDHAVKRANRALGLLMRSVQTGARPGKFRTSAVLTAYFANVRSILEYGSVIWAGAAETHTARIDRVQHKFLMWLLSYTLSGYAPSLSYENLLHHFRLPSLSSRRMQHDIIFIRNIFRLNIDCADLLASFALHIPTRSTRAYKLFNEPRARVNTIQSSLFCRLPRVANSFLNKCNRVDVFNDTFHAFKRAVIRYVNEM